MKINSITDIITNSSDEVFLFKKNVFDKKVPADIMERLDWWYFDTEESLKKYVLKGRVPLKKPNETYFIIDDLDYFVVHHPLSRTSHGFDSWTLKRNLSEDDLWELIKDQYMPLLGKIFAYIPEDPDNVTMKEQELLQKISEEWKHLG